MIGPRFPIPGRTGKRGLFPAAGQIAKIRGEGTGDLRNWPSAVDSARRACAQACQQPRGAGRASPGKFKKAAYNKAAHPGPYCTIGPSALLRLHLGPGVESGGQATFAGAGMSEGEPSHHHTKQLASHIVRLPRMQFPVFIDRDRYPTVAPISVCVIFRPY